MKPTFPLLEQLGVAPTIERVPSDDGFAKFKITMPRVRIRSLAGLAPLVTFPGHDEPMPVRLRPPFDRTRVWAA